MVQYGQRTNADKRWVGLSASGERFEMEHQGFPTLGSMTLGANDTTVSPVEILALTDVRKGSLHIKFIQVTE
jgi:hypothetical protein